MKSPLSFRKGIPFFCNKSESDFRKDVYEQYESMVVRQSALHLADQVWGKYPLQPILDFAADFYPDGSVQNILEIGSGVGRWIATLAQLYPHASCWGIDYSYQMLKRANEYWILGQDLFIDLSNRGFDSTHTLKGHRLTNLNLGLSKASNLPFSNNSQDLVLNSFLLDRLDEPMKGLMEMYRVLRPKGKLIVVTPLNFNHVTHWKTLYPANKIYDVLSQMGFSIEEWKEELIIQEPLDFRGNVVTWNCLAFVGVKYPAISN